MAAADLACAQGSPCRAFAADAAAVAESCDGWQREVGVGAASDRVAGEGQGRGEGRPWTAAVDFVAWTGPS